MGAGMPDKLWAIDFDGMIGGNGSYVECDGQVVMHQLISKEDTKVIVDWLQERVLAFYLPQTIQRSGLSYHAPIRHA